MREPLLSKKGRSKQKAQERGGYRVSIRNSDPSALTERISELHATAISKTYNPECSDTRPSGKSSEPSRQVFGDIKIQEPID